MKKYFNIKKKDQKGFTLLEYCAGAAVLIGIVVFSMQTLGNGMSSYFQTLNNWLKNQKVQVSADGSGGAGSTAGDDDSSQ